MTSPREDDAPTRSIELEVEVPGTPEEVWAAIATGPGITAWFVPSQIEEREGGTARTDFGALGVDESVVTAWEPPRRFAAQGPPGGIAHEVVVEARSGGTCLVRLINSGFTGEWEDQIEATREGWRKYLHHLELYLTHFRGQRSATIQVVGSAPGTPRDALAALSDALATGAPAPGEPIAARAPDAPPLRGTVDDAAPDAIMLLTDEPAPGYGLVAAFPFGEKAMTTIHLHLFGPQADTVAARDQPAWQAWMDARFPLEIPAATG